MRILLHKYLDKPPSHATLKKEALAYYQSWTWTHQAATILHNYGLSVNYCTTLDPKLHRTLEGRSLSVESEYKKHGNPRIAKETLRVAMARNLVTFRAMTFESIEDEFRKGRDVAVVLDVNRLTGRSGFRGHMVVLYEITADRVLFSGYRRPVESTDHQRFRTAWEADGTDRDVLIVSGRRHALET